MAAPHRARAWRTADAERDTSWVLTLSADEAEGFDQALQHARRAAKPLTEMTQADFPLPAAAP